MLSGGSGQENRTPRGEGTTDNGSTEHKNNLSFKGEGREKKKGRTRGMRTGYGIPGTTNNHTKEKQEHASIEEETLQERKREREKQSKANNDDSE